MTAKFANLRKIRMTGVFVSPYSVKEKHPSSHFNVFLLNFTVICDATLFCERGLWQKFHIIIKIILALRVKLSFVY